MLDDIDLILQGLGGPELRAVAERLTIRFGARERVDAMRAKLKELTDRDALIGSLRVADMKVLLLNMGASTSGKQHELGGRIFQILGDPVARKKAELAVRNQHAAAGDDLAASAGSLPSLIDAMRQAKLCPCGSGRRFLACHGLPGASAGAPPTPSARSKPSPSQSSQGSTSGSWGGGPSPDEGQRMPGGARSTGDRTKTTAHGADDLTAEERFALGAADLTWPTTLEELRRAQKRLTADFHTDKVGGGHEALTKLMQKWNPGFDKLKARLARSESK